MRREEGAPWTGARVEAMPWWAGTPEDEAGQGGLDPLGRSAGLERRPACGGPPPDELPTPLSS